MNTDRLNVSNLPPITLLAACGAALAIGGCSFNKAAAPEPTPTTAVAAAEPAPASNCTIGCVRTASTPPANSSAFSTPSTPSTPATRQARQFDPFWIEAAAAADRNIWMGNPAFANNSNSGRAILAGQTFEFAKPAAGEGGVTDPVEGLTHVSFASEGADFDPCLSRDGKFIVYASTQHRPTADIYLKRTDGRTITQLTSDPAHDLMPSISPDGQRIAFASDRSGNWDIYVMAVTGGQAVQLTDDSAQEVAPSWSADGKKMVFSRFGEMSGRWEMWVLDANASASAEFVGYGLFPKWCPKMAAGADGRDRILFQRSRERGDRAFSIWTIDYKPGDASAPTEIVSSPNTALINADWSPDGERIVYASVENPGDAGNSTPSPAVSDLWMANIDGSGRVNLTNGKFMNLMPSWSKDGRIYFVSNRGGTTNLWALGTEKAIFAATGPTTQKTNSAVADVPEHHEEQPQH